MNQNFLALIALLSPLLFAATAICSWFQPGLRPKMVKSLGIISAAVSIIIAAVSGFLVVENGLLETAFIGFKNIGLSLRLDAVSIIMFAMIALLSFIIIKYSFNYLDGDKRQGVFIGRLAAAIASVQLLVLSGNLGLLFLSWVLTSMSLHRLLVFYRERPGAIIAARKKFILARLGDVFLLMAVITLYTQFGTGNLEVIFQSIKNSLASGLSIEGIETPSILFAVAALLKSAQFPTHGWLIEVMETPTPVSALLHAGLLNAGPFLIVRMSFLMDASSYAPVILIILGGLTALFASVVFLTQTSIKTALGYSSVAHMGFSLLVCGLGVYPAAMLHLVAHSFYKAHSFLASGSVIDVIRSSKVTASKRTGSPLKILLGIVLAIGVYTGFALVWGIDPVKEFSLLIIGAIIVLGLSRIFTSAFDSNGGINLIIRASVIALMVTTAFFVLESAMHYLMVSQVPELVKPGGIKIIFISTILAIFAITVFIQILAPAFTEKSQYRALTIHIRNGLYINTVFDRTVRALYSHGSQNKPAVIESIENIETEESVVEEELEENPV
jgi:NAD(P)H-quinone oxidoreductase subunit 5